MTQQRNGRRGAVFTLRVTDEERARLEAQQRQGGGPRHLGPWILWRALTTGAVVPDQGAGRGNTHSIARAARVGNTRAQRHDPEETTSRRRGSTPPRHGTTGAAPPPIHERVILDLCAGSGAWSEPYARAGYPVQRVTLPEHDVRTFIPCGPVWGIVAAPPCNQFSLARNGHTSPRDFIGGMETVNAVLRIVFQCAPVWWALENPVGHLSRWLGTPRDVFDPCDFGDAWTKRTALWGDFEIPERGPFVTPLGGGPFCDVCDPTRRATSWCSNAAHRARTPSGFARAFFLANP